MGACTSSKMVRVPTAVALPKERAEKLKQEGAIRRSHLVLEHPQNVADAYEIAEPALGDGRRAPLLLGRCKVTGRCRAIRDISKVHHKNPKALKQEVALMKDMDHPNIIRLFEVFEDHTRHTLVMEVCEGGTLFDRIAEVGHFDERDAAGVVRDVLRAVFYMHKRDIVHRDLKPESFMLQSPGPLAGNSLKLVDFGTARSATETTILSTRIGMPFYFAPEVWKGRYTRKCDIWSCGAVAYALLCGSPPFTGASDGEVLEKVRRGVLTFKEPAWQGASDKAQTFVCQLMRTNARERHDAKQALSHEWISECAPKGPELVPFSEKEKIHFVGSWRSYRRANKLKRAALHVIAHQLDCVETRSLRDNFIALDTDGDGHLTCEQLRDPLVMAGLIESDEDLQEVMDAVDTDGSGALDYTEFIAASIDGCGAINRDVCWTAFSLFDRDGDGQISAAELAQVLDGGKLKKTSTDMMRHLDSNNDGNIDFREFLQMMDVHEPPSDDKHTGSEDMDKVPTTAGQSENTPTASARQGGA
mmetsp:Transcript_80667/g.207690  ORF Transcript_80667/g.207690 Transcript_80667/m.207690 type:complete len:530 (-) Transcript_80667:243-1832(-)